MGELVVSSYVTLDGVMQAPGAPDEDHEGGFEYGGWQAPYIDDDTVQVIEQHYAAIDALLLGRRTYEIFASYWPHASSDNPFTARMNDLPKYVASRTLKSVDWNNSRLIEGDVSSEVARLKGVHNSIHVTGSADLAQTLLRDDLIDRINLWVYPLVLGTGKRLFAEGTVAAALKLAESRTFDSGAVLLTYERAGKPTFGTIE